MVFTLELIVNPVILFVAVIGGGAVGFIIGKVKLARSRAKVEELEKEMINSHAEILELQKSYVQLENKLQQQSIPVISMKLNTKDSNPKENVRKTGGTPEK